MSERRGRIWLCRACGTELPRFAHRCPPCARLRNLDLVRRRYVEDRARILAAKRVHYRTHRQAIRARQHATRKPFVSSPARRAYMRAYMRRWRAA